MKKLLTLTIFLASSFLYGHEGIEVEEIFPPVEVVKFEFKADKVLEFYLLDTTLYKNIRIEAVDYSTFYISYDKKHLNGHRDYRLGLFCRYLGHSGYNDSLLKIENVKRGQDMISMHGDGSEDKFFTFKATTVKKLMKVIDLPCYNY